MQDKIRSSLTVAQLTGNGDWEQAVDNLWLLPVSTAGEEHQPLAHHIAIHETRMQCNHQNVEVTGQRVDLFPAVSFRLASDGKILVPLDRGLLRDPAGNSYWDVTLSPGQIWSEPGDDGWSRAALPFQLSNIYENDTHHGVATFLYDGQGISAIYFQITTETKAFLCPDNLLAWGKLETDCTPLNSGDTAPAISQIKQELADQLPLIALDHWHSDATEACFNDIKSGFGSDTSVVNGLVIDDKIYATPCPTSVGDFPYPRAMKFGIWSATKTAFTSIACLRLAQITGEDPRNALVTDLLPEGAGNANWSDITIGHCLNMATGIGTAGPETEPLNIFADYLLRQEQADVSRISQKSFDHYYDWFLAPSQHEKNIAAFACPSFTWGPGSIARYRDQDLYIAGAALDAWLKHRVNPGAKLWEVVRDQVYGPARIHHAVKFQTIETDPANEVPLSDAGLLLTMDNVARLGQLIHANGRIDGQQILHPGMLDELFNPAVSKGLATGTSTSDGEVYYHGGIWRLPYKSLNNRTWLIPSMRGYGGQIIQILPNGTTVFRFGHDSDATEERFDMLKLVRLSDTIRPFPD